MKLPSSFRALLRCLSALLLMAAASPAQVPQIVNYQGRVAVPNPAGAGTVNFNGTGSFKFVLTNSAGTVLYWSNDGSQTTGAEPNGFEPTTALQIPVQNGLYSVVLGDTTVAGMTAFPADAFSSGDLRLRIWFDDGTHQSQRFKPDQRITPVAYALVAGSVSDGAVTTAKLAPGGVGSAQLANGLTLGGTTTGTFSGNLAGNAATATSAGSFTGALLGDVTGNQGATVVGNVGGITAGAVAAGSNLANAATDANIAGKLVKRDSSGNLSVGTITLSGVNLAPTSGLSVGVIMQGGSPLIHTYGGASNFFAGNGAGNFTMTGTFNTALGALSLTANTTGSGNMASGIHALQKNTTGSNNTASGSDTLVANTTGSNNTASGNSALQNNLDGAYNTAAGVNALFHNSSGVQNTGLGVEVLFQNQTSNYNTAVGYLALHEHVIGDFNVACGGYAMYSHTSGTQNAALGYAALTTSTTSNNNTAVGYAALHFNTTGDNNVAVGYAAGNNIKPKSDGTGGTDNIAIGYQAGSNLINGAFNIAIGHPGTTSDDKVIRIGNTQTRTFIAGIKSVQTGSSTTSTVLIDSNGQLGTIQSSRRYKEDINDMGETSKRLRALRPVTFRYKRPYDNGEKPVQFGLIAEEVAEVFPELAIFNDEGQPETVKYQDLAPLLLNEVQKLENERDRLRARVESLEAGDRAREARLEKLEKLLQPARPKGSSTHKPR